MPFDDTGINLLIAQQGQHVLAACFAVKDLDFNPFDTASSIDLFHLTIHQPLWPAYLRERGTSVATVARRGIMTPKGFQNGRFITLVGIREDRWQVPWLQTTLGVLHEGLRLRVRPFAYHQTHDQLAVRRHRRVVPHIASPLHLGALAPLLLFFTKLHCSS